MFNDYGRPFYQSSETINLERLDINRYSDFISNHFLENKKSIDKTLIEEYISILDSYTFYVQYFFNRLFENSTRKIEKKQPIKYFWIS